MSEAKHTPLPWEVGRSGLTRAFTIFHRDTDGPTYVGAHGTYAQITEQNARLIVTSVNARPKVEELVTAVIMADQGDLEQADRANKLAREVEAMLGGK
ncbi:hypothetical protein LCGC14_1567620 [marine sediment metagenome]|uniref:Uncharacterized protein n=1 Tax=marine sediment metagenome TaxID=412755 RepID=A0A0F9IKJ9_9ZZZZ